jgi:hypothetical protein
MDEKPPQHELISFVTYSGLLRGIERMARKNGLPSSKLT